jgi:hypothetical protein
MEPTTLSACFVRGSIDFVRALAPDGHAGMRLRLLDILWVDAPFS